MKISSLTAVLASALLFAGAATADQGPQAFVYKNGEASMYVIHHAPEEVTVKYDGAVYSMKQTVSASGAIYETPGDPSTSFMSKGNEAWLTIAGKDVPGEFTIAREFLIKDSIEISISGEKFLMTRVASDKSVRYEAVDDPTTSFESFGKSSVMTLRGEVLHTYVLFSFSPNGHDLFLSVDGESFILEQKQTPSGLRYEAIGDPATYFVSNGDAASLFIHGAENTGYDASVNAIASLLPIATRDERAPGEFSRMPIGSNWSIKSVKGVPITKATIAFDDGSRVYGAAPVNHYTSTWFETRGRILIESPASTKMMGPNDEMDAEAMFFQALADVRRFEIFGDELVLYTKQGEEITAVRIK